MAVRGDVPGSDAGKTKETSADHLEVGIWAGGTDGEETAAVVQVGVWVQVTLGQVNRAGIETGCLRQRPHQRTAGDCQLVPKKGPCGQQ